jgi:hypothetical protein
MEKQTFDLAQLKNKGELMEIYNALMATVLGTDDQRAAALQYLKEIDPEIWDQEE